MPYDPNQMAGVFGADPDSMPFFLRTGMASAPPEQSRLLDPFNPPRIRGPVEAIAEALDYRKPWTAGGALQAMMMALPMGRGVQPMQNGAVNPVIPMRPFKPNTYFPDEPPMAANMNPPSKLNWRGPDDVQREPVFSGVGRQTVAPDPVRGEPGFSFATDARGNNLAGITDRWNWNGGQDSHYTYTPRIHGATRGGTTEVHQGPEFRSRDVAKDYIDTLLKSGKFGRAPDQSFAAPFLDQDSQILRQLMAERARQQFRPVE